MGTSAARMTRSTYLLSFPDASESTHQVERFGDSPFARIDHVRDVWLLMRVTTVGYEKYVDGTVVEAKAWVRRATDEELVTLAMPTTAAPAG
jgi:hypothetical protein